MYAEDIVINLPLTIYKLQLFSLLDASRYVSREPGEEILSK